jgi:hypothetical protein
MFSNVDGTAVDFPLFGDPRHGSIVAANDDLRAFS